MIRITVEFAVDDVADVGSATNGHVPTDHGTAIALCHINRALVGDKQELVSACLAEECCRERQEGEQP